MNTTLDFRPLYAVVKQRLMQRLIKGEWRSGKILPSETALASEFGVSQGTVRKALDAMAGENLLVRKQGKGTFVAEHDPHRALFHFFHLIGDDGVRQLPRSRVLECTRQEATPRAAERLRVPPGSAVIRFRRVRSLDERPVMVETIVVPEPLFPGLSPVADEEPPNTLYALYERQYGIVIVGAAERLRAVAAAADDAALLGLAAGAPLIEIERTAFTFNQKPVELRVSRCDTRSHHYLSELE